MAKSKQQKIIEVENLVKAYKKTKSPAVDNVSFQVKKGELFALLGPNGAGKTTTLSILTTTLSKTSGKVLVAGADLDKNQNEIRQKIGVIFQNASLDENLTGEENIRFHANLYGLYSFRPSFKFMPSSYQKQVKKMANLMNLEDNIFKPIKTYSGGMRRKLEIIRGLMHDPAILFLDEPTTGLDPASRRSLWDYLEKIRKQNAVTIFLTTHYLDEAENADWITIVKNGKIATEGKPAEIKKSLVDNYMIINSHYHKKLEKELSSKNIKYKSKNPFIIPLNDKGPEQIMQNLETKLNYLDIHTPTLEEAYLNLINE